jgi:anti-sigma factor (TIGR02949 family)
MSENTPCSCKEAFEKLDDYLCRELTADDIARLEGHLCECIECAEWYQFEGRMLECVRKKIEMISLPADLAERVKAALDKNEG